MGQEHEAKHKIEKFAGFQVSEAMATSGKAHKDWKFMHCLPRHQEEVTNDVFYGSRSLVFPEVRPVEINI